LRSFSNAWYSFIACSICCFGNVAPKRLTMGAAPEPLRGRVECIELARRFVKLAGRGGACVDPAARQRREARGVRDQLTRLV
jgi:hypothetical protein